MQLKEYSDRIATYFLTNTELQKGDAVAVYMSNSPEFIGTWLGLAKIGLVAALVNTNQRLKPLAHAIITSKSKVLFKP